jgi:nucleotidyltransferase/DNA polymerase involved in DNA repair
MRFRICELKSIGLQNIRKLRSEGFKYALDLLLTTPQSISHMTNIPEADITRWVNMVNLMAVPTVGPKYAALLQKVGIPTVRDLAAQDAGTVLANLTTGRKTYYDLRVGILPNFKRVQAWIDYARWTKRNGAEGEAHGSPTRV